MSENENQSVIEPVIETTAPATAVTNKKSKLKVYVAAVLLAAVIILGVLFVLEKEGRSSTNIFGALIASQEANKTVALVNGEEIKNSDLLTSIQQFTQVAAAQGVDTSSAAAQTDIKTQALDVLVNTRLLKQDATNKGYSVSDEVANERLETIKTEIGGEEVLTQRMTELGIKMEQLKRDIKDELLIQQLLDAIFLEANISVSEAEILEFYNNAGGAEAGLPALEVVRPQVEAQIKGSKEQAAIDAYLNNLKTTAQIEIK
jgi:FKBP-type peptidyl-prolyl cis-trans isomerase (trigger factor)